LRSRRRALVGAVAALVPFFPGALLAIPMGIWALVLMNKDEVKRSFGQKKTKVEGPPNIRDFAVSTAESVKEAIRLTDGAIIKDLPLLEFESLSTAGYITDRSFQESDPEEYWP